MGRKSRMHTSSICVISDLSSKKATIVCELQKRGTTRSARGKVGGHVKTLEPCAVSVIRSRVKGPIQETHNPEFESPTPCESNYRASSPSLSLSPIHLEFKDSNRNWIVGCENRRVFYLVEKEMRQKFVLFQILRMR